MTDESGEQGNLHLRITTGGTTVEVKGPTPKAEEWFEKISDDYIDKLASASVADSPPESGESSNYSAKSVEHGEGKPRSLSEYFDDVDGANKQETALFVGWYLEAENEEGDFTVDEIGEASSTYKIPLGENIGRDIRAQVSKGNIDEYNTREGDQTFRLTRSGETYVEEELLNSGESD